MLFGIFAPVFCVSGASEASAVMALSFAPFGDCGVQVIAVPRVLGYCRNHLAGTQCGQDFSFRIGCHGLVGIVRRRTSQQHADQHNRRIRGGCAGESLLPLATPSATFSFSFHIQLSRFDMLVKCFRKIMLARIQIDEPEKEIVAWSWVERRGKRG